jgi:hypothetical protein
MSTLELALAIVALVLALVEEFQSQGRSLLGWAVVALAAIFLIGRLG